MRSMKAGSAPKDMVQDLTYPLHLEENTQAFRATEVE
jgi:hypothetical protein